MSSKCFSVLVLALSVGLFGVASFWPCAAWAQPTELDPGAGNEDSGGIPDPEPPEEEYDPWDGIDPNGRIPKADIPDDIKHPERWRYIPEGRIKPGNPFQRFLVSSFIAPYVFSNGDVGTGFGVAFTDIDFRLKRRREFAGISASYTTKGQQRYSLSWRRMLKTRDLPEGGVIQEERSYVYARVQYSKTLTRRFFGYGPDTLESAESSYLDEAVIVAFGFSSSLPEPMDDFVLELGLNVESHELGNGTVEGVPTTQQAFPLVFDPDRDRQFGLIRAELRWDTRDSQRNPYSGQSIGFRVDAPLAQNEGDVGAVFKLFGTQIFEVPGIFHRGGDSQEAHPPTDTLAFGLFAQGSVGSMPFYLLPTLGGTNTLRGYVDGRWRDRAAWQGAAEYRFWVIPRGIPITRNIRIERLGLALFYEIGAVAEDVGAIFHSRVAQSYGFGFRVGLERAAIFRLDLGFSDDGLNFAAGFGLSF
ncbi:MAG: BamA/TamA family outer membrane protein [Myxococcota bacterium]|nr:BamA/TamA family outer membrane protein [Myxococcota bacterium]